MKKFAAILLSAIMLTAQISVSASSDEWEAYSWAELGYTWAKGLGISEKYLLSPSAILTHEDAAQLLYEIYGDETAWTLTSRLEGATEEDVNPAAAQGYVLSGDTSQSGDAVTREEFAAILYSKASSPQIKTESLASFSDYADIDDWAENAMAWAVRTELYKGDGNGRLYPASGITVAEALVILERASRLPDFAQMSTDLSTIASFPHPTGSKEETAAAEYIETRFSDMGYKTALLPYVRNNEDNGAEGTNVVAVKEADNASADSADILVISAHHDSVPPAYGASDNASGVVSILAVADMVKSINTDTELRFISFTDEEKGKGGSRAYVEALPEEERSRVIGDIQIDMIGGIGSDYTALFTMDGEKNWLTDLLQGYDNIPLEKGTLSDHSSFQLAGIPSVLMSQNSNGYVYHSVADTADCVDLCVLSDAAVLVTSAIKEIASADTASYRETAQEQGQGFTSLQSRDIPIYFGLSVNETEGYIGASGELKEHYEDDYKDVHDIYMYSMRWFGCETPMNTYYEYRNGALEHLEIRPSENGFTYDDMLEIISAVYGAPQSSKTNDDGSTQSNWADTVYNRFISLVSEGAGCVVQIDSNGQMIADVIQSYPVKDGEADVDNPKHKEIWDYLTSIIPKSAMEKLAEFNIASDGYSGVLAYASTVTKEDGSEDNSRFAINVDINDAFDENGDKRDWTKLTFTIIHEFGHILLENDTQIDLSISNSIHDTAGFIDGSMRKAYYDRFWAASGSLSGDYAGHPTDYVREYAANYFHEDIADSFALFVLGNKPQGELISEQKMLFFYEYEDMVNLRSQIRTSLGLS